MSSTPLTLRVRPDSDALHRVVTVLRRRQIEIRSLSYEEDGQMRLEIVEDPQRGPQAVAWLAALVDVLDVRRAHGRPNAQPVLEAQA